MVLSPRAVLAAWTLVGAAVGGGGGVAVQDMAPAGASPTVQIAVAIRAACPAIAGDSEKVARFVAISLAEDGNSDPARQGDVGLEDGTWGPSVGWYQVRSLWAQDHTGGERDRFALTDPAANSASACSISAQGTYWTPWTTYTNGAYLSHLTEGRQAASTAMGVDVSAGAATAIAAVNSSDCAAPGGHGLGAFLDRTWCNVVIGPWEKLGKRPKTGAWWGKVDSWVFGPPKNGAAKGKPSSLATGGPVLPGSDGLDPSFAQHLAAMAAAAPGSLTIGSGFRTVQDQLDLGGGDLETCGPLVACVRNGVCGSMHCKGLAVDLKFGDDTVKAWAHAHAADYGLVFRMNYEDWHIEPIGAFEAQQGATA